MDYKIDFGDEFDQHASETEAKGWFDARVRVDGSEITISFYDPVRLAQEVEGALDRAGLFFERNLMVIPKVNRQNMEKAVKAAGPHFT